MSTKHECDSMTTMPNPPMVSPAEAAKALITEPHLEAPDDFYEALIHAHRDLDTARSHELNAKLVLLLANHIGHQAVLEQALVAARVSTARTPEND
jgi:hypothetical protein